MFEFIGSLPNLAAIPSYPFTKWRRGVAQENYNWISGRGGNAMGDEYFGIY